MMTILVLLRHGQSQWNKANLFTGWVDVPLTKEGVNEALAAGEIIKDIPLEAIFTSTLMRAQQTAMLATLASTSSNVPCVVHDDDFLQQKEIIYSEKSQRETIPVYIDYRLNERHYGELQGKNKADTIQKYGAAQVKIWRRSFDVPPPSGESLEMTAKRTLPCLDERILPRLLKGENVLVAAHGNSLRSIVMSIENLTKEEVLSLELPTGEPRAYAFKDDQFERVKLP